MSTIIATVVFFALVIFWVSLPLLPAWKEFRRKDDANPLEVVRRYEVNVRHFAIGFKTFLNTHFVALIAQCKQDGQQIIGTREGGAPYLIIPGNQNNTDLPELENTQDHLILSCGDLNIPEGREFPLEVYAEQNLTAGDGCTFRALLADQDVILGKECSSVRWLHAGRNLVAGDLCRFYGRVSADQKIRLGANCDFERLHSPTIEFGEPVVVDLPAIEKHTVDPGKWSNLEEFAADRYLFQKELKVPEGSIITSDLVVLGPLTIEDGVKITGSVKSHGDLTIGQGVEISGSVVSRKDIFINRGCSISGLLLAENRAQISEGCTLGTSEHLTTVSAAGLKIDAGVVVHGTVWGGVV